MLYVCGKISGFFCLQRYNVILGEGRRRSIKAIITDLDRTLLHRSKSISEYTIEVLEKCRAKGILIMAATARPERNIPAYHAQIHFDAMTIMNGAGVLLPEQKQLRYGTFRGNGR